MTQALESRESKRTATPAFNEVHLGDAIELLQRLDDNSVDSIIADPPYNASLGKSLGLTGSTKLPGMGGAWNLSNADWDKSSLADLVEFTRAWLQESARVLRPSGSMWVMGTYHNIGVTNFLMQTLGIEIINEVIWYKRNAFPNLRATRLTASHETILWAHTGNSRDYFFDYEYSKESSFNYDLLKKEGKQQRTVLDIPNNKTPEELVHGKHPTQKPVRLAERLLRLSTRPGDIVLVPFAGSGTECVAAKSIQRQFIGFEQDPEYVELAKKRLKAIQ